MELRAGKVLLEAERIAARVAELAAEINGAHGGRPLTLVGVLDGCLIFLADLVRRLDMPIEIALVRVKTYGDSTRPEKRPIIPQEDIAHLRGRHVLIVDDIYDSGGTLFALEKAVRELGAASVRKCVLLAKERDREREAALDYVGFRIPDVFVVGYGLDHAGQYRNLPYIAELEARDTDRAFA